MNYINPNKNPSGAYPNLQSNPATGLLEFPDEFLSEFYKEGKARAGFVTIEHDGKTVTSCVWNEEAYQADLEQYPLPSETEPTETVSAMDQMRADIDYIAMETGVTL